MLTPSPLPALGQMYVDRRGDQRMLRVSWHLERGDEGMVVLSLWRDGVCVGSAQLDADQVADLVDVLRSGLDP